MANEKRDLTKLKEKFNEDFLRMIPDAIRDKTKVSREKSFTLCQKADIYAYPGSGQDS